MFSNVLGDNGISPWIDIFKVVVFEGAADVHIRGNSEEYEHEERVPESLALRALGQCLFDFSDIEGAQLPVSGNGTDEDEQPHSEEDTIVERDMEQIEDDAYDAHCGKADAEAHDELLKPVGLPVFDEEVDERSGAECDDKKVDGAEPVHRVHSVPFPRVFSTLPLCGLIWWTIIERLVL